MTCRNKAFTLMELLVVVAIIGLLVGVVVVSMQAVRASATRSESLGALRQMALAYGQYTDEHRGRLMPGYLDENVLTDLNISAELEDGTKLDQAFCAGGMCDAGSYVWRLAPYLDDAWLTFFTETDVGTRSVFVAEYGDPNNPIYGPAGASAYAGGISERPSYGLNSIFVGGDSTHGGANITNRNPWDGTEDKIAATRLSEVKNPSRLIVFGPAAKAGTGQTYEDPEVGFCELRPPYLVLNDASDIWEEPQWKVGIGGLVEQTPGGEYADGAGLPIARSGKDLIPMAHLDGSTVVIAISKLSRDMRFWSPFEVGLRTTAAP
jgi:prepilin-type N-terminal cleavage/methylation domain-containing protein